MRHVKRILAIWSAASLCAGLPSPSRAISDQEQQSRLEFTSAEADRAIAESGALYNDPVLEAYLQQLLDTLYPDQPGHFKAHALRSADWNAFCMPNGSIYFNIGLLVDLDNESQLAAVAGHEGAHYIERHALRARKNEKITLPMADVLTLGSGVPMLFQVLAVSSIMGYSRDDERAADRIGFERMTRAGFDPQAGTVVFEERAAAVKILKLKQPMFFASHPRLQERAENFRNFAKAATATPVERNRTPDRYLEVTQAARLDAIHELNTRGDGRGLIYILEKPGRLIALPPGTRYYLAEGYRLRREKGDQEKAIEQYWLTLEEAPNEAGSYGALGTLYMQQGRKELALPLLRRYLELSPDGKDSAYIERYVATLEQEPAS